MARSTPSLVHPDLAHVCEAAARHGRSRLWGLVEHPRGYRLVDTGRAAVPDELVGFTAPDDWAGLVMGATGTMRHLDAAHGPVRVRIGYALDRAGRAADSLTELDGRRVPTHGAPTVGHMVDVAHRILGLACAPETTDTLPLLLSSWLVEVLDLATDPAMEGWTDDWLAVADLHPAAELCQGRTPAELSAALALPGAIPSWDDVYDAAVELGLGTAGFDAREVEWLDAPSLARFMIAELPDPVALLARLGEVLPTPVADLVVDSVFRAVARRA